MIFSGFPASRAWAVKTSFSFSSNSEEINTNYIIANKLIAFQSNNSRLNNNQLDFIKIKERQIDLDSNQFVFGNVPTISP